MEYFGFIMNKVYGLKFKQSMDEEAPGRKSALSQKTGAQTWKRKSGIVSQKL